MSLVLVTGGEGFIGSHVVAGLLAEGFDVRVLDNLHPAAHAGEPVAPPDGVERLRGDLRDADAVRGALREVLHVCHQGAMVGLGVDLGDIADYVSHNDLGTAVLLREMATAGVAERLVLASSMVVYGEGRYECSEHGLVAAPPRTVADLDSGHFEPPCPQCARPLSPSPVLEDAPLDPRNVYAATKLHQEHLCAAFARETGVAVTALRYHNVYGPGMPRDTPYAGVASIFRSALAAGRAPQVFEDGGQLRDFVHVGDVARANVLALTSPDPVAGAFNVASGEPHSVGEMACELAAAAGSQTPEPVVTGEYRLGDVRHVFASSELAAQRLGFSAEVGFTDGMREFATARLRGAAPA